MAIRIAQFGLGPIGLETLKLAARKPWAEILGAIDIDPGKQGDLGERTGMASLRGRRTFGSIDELLTAGKPDVILHTTVSRFKEAFPQIERLVQRGIDVVSSCEELIFPQLREPELAKMLDALCQREGVRVIGTGVNPGFVMDLLPLCLTGVTGAVRSIEIERVVDASTRREPLQRKIGSGLPPVEFQRSLQSGQAGHAGLRESLGLIAHALNWQIDEITERAEVLVAEQVIKTPFLAVQPGSSCGIHQRLEAKVQGRVRLVLDLKMFLGAPSPHDRIRIDGDPPLDVTIRGGVAGDQATVAALVNTVPRLSGARPGLLLPIDLPVPRLT